MSFNPWKWKTKKGCLEGKRKKKATKNPKKLDGATYIFNHAPIAIYAHNNKHY